MNERIIKIGLESGMLNYVDNETPRHYFLSGYADEQDLEKFAELIVKECINLCEDEWNGDADTFLASEAYNECAEAIKEHFGVGE